MNQLRLLGWILIVMFAISFVSLKEGFDFNLSGFTGFIAFLTPLLIAIGLFYLDKRISKKRAKRIR